MRADFTNERKRLGQYFTPASEAEWLAKWAIRTRFDRILEPSVGDGALLFPALNRLTELGGSTPNSIVGCDIDPVVIASLAERLNGQLTLVKSDFFDLHPSQIASVDVILANPPFTRNHQIVAPVRKSLRDRYPLRGAAGLWAYFVLHAVEFLRPGGRIAIFVPGAATFADYATDLLKKLKSEFRQVSVNELPRKPSWVGGADERGVLLLAEGFRQTDAIHRSTITPWMSSPSRLPHPNPFKLLKKHSRPLSDFAELSIGAVTGFNQVFLLSQPEIDELRLSREDIVPIVSRSKQVLGLFTSAAELAELAQRGQKTWLLLPHELGEKGGAVRRRLSLISASRRRRTAWFKKRHPWWKVETGAKYDAVFTYMNDVGPRVSLVEPGVACTNTLHKVTFHKGTDTAKRISISISMLSTFSQLAAEGIGRGYGGGVLKFELKEARKFPVLPCKEDSCAAICAPIDDALRSGRIDLARKIADETIMPDLLGPTWRADLQALEATLELARTSRRQGDARIFLYDG
jgi:tRNA1(Val) A37 N6-methylase TrmN6